MNKTFLISVLALLILGIVAQADVFKMATGLTSLETVVVGNPGNKADDTGFGAVPYPFKIGMFEVTAAQYVEFLNAKAKSDPYDLYHLHMAETGKVQCKIERIGESGSYAYSVIPEYANRPVDWVSYWDACRFANWLHNGQEDGDTETGAYTLNGYKGTDGRKIVRNSNAKWFVPSEDEWYKAAYYDPAKLGGAGYWNYPTRSDAKPNREFAGTNAANYYDGTYLDPVHYLTEAGAFSNSKSAYGTFDQGGNIFEWNEALAPPPFLRCLRGGSFATDAGLNVRAPNRDMGSQDQNDYVGFRIAGAVEGTDAFAPAASVGTGVTQSGVVKFSHRPWPNPETGKPFFPLGWFTWGSDKADLDQLALEGANTVLYVYSPTELDESDVKTKQNMASLKAYLDHAYKRGIKVLVVCNGWHDAFEKNDAARIGRARKWVEALSKHPALLGYQIYDEPEYRGGGGMKEEDVKKTKAFADGLIKAREAIRQWDSNRDHLVQTVFNMVPLSSWTEYLPAIDTFQIDRYPCGANFAYFGHKGDWGPLIMAWSIAHGVANIQTTAHRNPSPVLQAVGLGYYENGYWWRDPLYDETRYMAYSSMTVGGWGIIHWIRNVSSKNVRSNVARLYRELRQIIPAFEKSWAQPPFTVSHNYEGITRDFLTDSISDISTLALEDEKNYYLIASDNSSTFDDVSIRMRLPNIKDTKTREASVLNEDWSRNVTYDSATGEWIITTHKMCFGDINIWVIPKVAQ